MALADPHIGDGLSFLDSVEGAWRYAEVKPAGCF